LEVSRQTHQLKRPASVWGRKQAATNSSI
jgi:hypothetical protein